MAQSKPPIQSQITFLYHRDLGPADKLYREVTGFEVETTDRCSEEFPLFDGGN